MLKIGPIGLTIPAEERFAPLLDAFASYFKPTLGLDEDIVSDYHSCMNTVWQELFKESKGNIIEWQLSMDELEISLRWQTEKHSLSLPTNLPLDGILELDLKSMGTNDWRITIPSVPIPLTSSALPHNKASSGIKDITPLPFDYPLPPMPLKQDMPVYLAFLELHKRLIDKDRVITLCAWDTEGLLMGIITAFRSRLGIEVFPPILFTEDDHGLFTSLYCAMDEHLRAKGIISWFTMHDALPLHPTGASEAGYTPLLGRVLYQKHLNLPHEETNSLPQAYADMLRACFKRAGLYREETTPVKAGTQDSWCLNWSLNNPFLFLQIYSFKDEKGLIERVIKPALSHKKPILLGLPMIYNMDKLINRLKSLGFSFAGFSSVIPYERDMDRAGDMLLMQYMADEIPVFNNTRANQFIESLASVVRKDYSSLRNGRKFLVKPTTAKP